MSNPSPATWLQNMARKQARLVQSEQGQALPASIVSMSGQIATVKIEVQSQTPWPLLEVPIATSPYDAIPLQKGDVGWLAPVTFSIAALAGLGTMPARVECPAPNMSAYVFVPFSSAAWPQPDPDARTLAGRKRVIIQSHAKGKASVVVDDDHITLQCDKSSVEVTPSTITLNAGGKEVVVSASGVTLDGIDFKSHTHESGQPGQPTGPAQAG
ncbi:hypothetical protein E3E12_08120 [Formicincola oecophyllae]|uniref:Uncharacterized protein n=1 Tax=Formicincola oecophyllae TaxID=2558361 RepID=A0A4Y6UCP5_9PROT|nr:hypothetical protein [Formicincola oecophyllae]QDH14161.1 hypothetical protein E3E12_08120 [Formicincola oecophyllae]